jgi:hypothetical protein
MKIPIFELERVQSIYENTVEFNLTESGFHPLKLSELLTPEQIEELTDTVLGYGQTNGSVPLRKRIASFYEGQNVDNVLVTNGSAEANFVACHSILEAGDEVVMMVPNYMQIWGIVEEMGGGSEGLPPARGERLGTGSRRTEDAGQRKNQDDCYLQPQQPDRLHADRRGNAGDRRDSGLGRGLDPLGRGL